MESSPRDRRPISFAPLTPAFHRRSATNHSCVIVLRGLKPTATVKCRSATGGGSAPPAGVARWSVRVVAVRQRRTRVPRLRSLRRGRANEAETWIVDGAITATSTVLPQTV